MQTPHGPLRSFGRIKARPIKPRQAALVETLLPSLAIDLAAPPLGDGETWLEIGFGGGEHMAEQAARRPDVRYLGAEPFWNGAASALRHIEEAGSHQRAPARRRRARPDRRPAGREPGARVRPLPRPLAQGAPPQAAPRAARLRSRAGRGCSRSGGRLRFATDWADYADRALETLRAEPALRWTAQRADDWRTPPAEHVTTRYETKKLGDCAPVFLDFERR